LAETVPRILATILNGTIIAGMVVLLHRSRASRLIALAHRRDVLIQAEPFNLSAKFRLKSRVTSLFRVAQSKEQTDAAADLMAV
jgi:hypothetical protein